MALKSFTGTLTRPNEIAPLHMDRGMSAPHLSSRSFVTAGGFFRDPHFGHRDTTRLQTPHVMYPGKHLGKRLLGPARRFRMTHAGVMGPWTPFIREDRSMSERTL